MNRWVLGGWLACAAAVPGYAQRTIVHFPLRLADLTVVSDTVSGLSLLMLPAVITKEARANPPLIWLRFHPDSAMEWINSAAGAIRVSASTDPAEGIQWSRPLTPRLGRGAIAMGRTRKKGALQKTHWLAISDSATGWRFEMGGKDADSLLRLFLVLGSQSRVDTSPFQPADSAGVDEPVRIIEQGEIELNQRRYKFGRVVAQYVVDTLGRVEPGSFVAFLATSPDLIGIFERAVGASRFLPARRGGAAIRQLVRQDFAYRPPP
jgi:hypothetical protein